LLKTSLGIICPARGFLYFLSQEKAKPAVRQRRKITDLLGDSRVALKKGNSAIFFQQSKINRSKT
jgi:hypothetical protein